MIEPSLPALGESSAPPPSLRDTLSAAFDEEEKKSGPLDAPVAQAAPGPSPSTADLSEPKVDSAGRAHAADGKFTAKEGAPLAPAPVAVAVAAPVAASADSALQRPKSWKKEYWPHWDKLTKGDALTRDEALALAKYQNEREGDFMRGVSTYKQEWDRARPVLEALHPHRDMISQANTTPEKFVAALASTHQVLTSGTKEEKLREIARFASSYGVPVNELLIQGDDGKVYLNQSYFQAQEKTPQALTAAEVDKRVAQQLAQRDHNITIKSFIEAKDAAGNPAYPHYEAVWNTMDGILRAGLVRDLPSAYKAALSLPQHSDLVTAQSPQLSATDEAEKKRQAQDSARRARAQTVSPRTQAPTALTSEQPRRDSLRATLEGAFNSHLGNGGRI